MAASCKLERHLNIIHISLFTLHLTINRKHSKVMRSPSQQGIFLSVVLKFINSGNNLVALNSVQIMKGWNEKTKKVKNEHPNYTRT